MSKDSLNVLLVSASLFADKSNSRALASSFVSALEASGQPFQLTHHDLVERDLPHLDSAEMQAWMTPADERSAEQRKLAALSDEFLAELKAADLLVVAAPLYNLGLPTQMKAWFDRVLRAGESFRYTEKGPVGLLEGKQALVLAARGGIYAGTEMDSQTPHLKSMLGLMGITDQHFVYAEGLNMGDESRAASLAEAKAAIANQVQALQFR
ncbi:MULTISPECIES: FMN-dependent NADH-azoreductase [unclassified Cobetia]|uniref:FMN-dependent NADH-azoreductase n=1 Tax=unclassified Cobetia TaxID=2609414 RepID=UPI00209813DD|nr:MULTISPECIES: NAD(P)H-dependent oxidoreductase [unclassified Cobetia]MCO7232526.1 NAD(P)H-dependent oxidoreductase [Cobetia sp. Dlab-2-AX]MCO7235800.1 NAD(P)H-dependent oxidoreductase [Cobetia sp. Dlab-2-U]